MQRPLVQRLSGTRDLDQAEFLSLKAAQDALQRLFQLHGYRIVDTPLLEETDLFLRKSGGELAARLYTFTDPAGHRVSLRPEFTSSTIRHYLEEKILEPLPLRRQYGGPVFRFQSLEEEGQRQFTQVGAELIGASEPWADAEVLSLAWQGISELGISGLRIVIGHIGVLQGLLDQFHLSERAKLSLIGSVPYLRRGPEGLEEARRRGEELGLFRRQREEELEEPLRSMGDEAARRVVQSLLKESVASPLGSRTPQEIIDRFIRKIQGADAPAQVEKALEFLGQLVHVRGKPEVSFTRAKTIARDYKLDLECFKGLEEILTTLAHHSLGDGEFSLDFGLVRDIAYYTGLIFELLPPPGSGETSVGGGGRYDGLIKALGGTEDIPALGFAYHLERVIELIERVIELTGSRDKRASHDEDRTLQILLVPKASDAYAPTLTLARELRADGKVVHLEVSPRTLEDSMAYARYNQIGSVLVVDAKGKTQEYTPLVGA